MSDGFSVRRDEPLARHSPWRVGGPVEAFLQVDTREGLAGAVALCREAGWSRWVLGAGTRTVFRDGGLAGAVIRLGADFMHLHDEGDGTVLAGAALPLSALASRVPGLDPRHPGSLGASIAADDGWDPWIHSVSWVGRGAERTTDLDELRAKGKGAVVTAARVRRDVTAPPPRIPAVAWWRGDDGEPVDAGLRRAGLADARLRTWCIPAATPSCLVNLGDGSLKDALLLHRSVVERAQREQGLALTLGLAAVGKS